MSLEKFVVPLVTFYLAIQLQQTNATVLVESATGKALIQSACSASDSPPACYAVLNPIANNPNLNPTDICSVALRAASNVARVTHNMLNVSAAIAAQVARDPSVRQSVLICSQQYAQVLDLVDKSATALTQKVDEDKVPEYLSSAIAAVAKCDASAVKVANAAVQITNKNLDCSKMLKNALGIYKVFAEYIENPSHDPKEIIGAAGGSMGGNFNFNAGAGASGGIIGLSAPTKSPTSKGDASTGTSSNNNNVQFSFAKRGEFRKEFSANGNMQSQPQSPSTDNSAEKGSTPSKISTDMKFQGLGLGLGQRIKGFFNPDSEKPDGGNSAGALQSGSSADAPETASTPSQISTTTKFEGLGLGLGHRIKGFFNPDSDNSESGSGASASQTAGAPETGSTPSQISTNQKFEGLGLGLGQRIKGFFNHDSGNTESENSADPSLSGSNTDAPQTGSTPSQISTNMKFEGLGLRQRIKGFIDPENKDGGSGAGAPQTGSTPSQISTDMKFEGLGLGFRKRIKGLFNSDSHEYPDSTGHRAGASQSESTAGAPETGSTPSQISTNTKFEGLGLGFGHRIKGFLHPNSESTDSVSSAGASQISGSSAAEPQIGSSAAEPQSGSGAAEPQSGSGAGEPQSGSGAGEPQSGSGAGSPVNAGLKFSLSGFAKSFTSSKKHKEQKETGSPSPAPAKAPSSSGSANAPSPVGSDAPVDAPDDAPDAAANSYSDDDVNVDTTDSPSPSPSGNNVNEVSLKYSLSHLIPDT